jgi:hypothetical protein
MVTQDRTTVADLPQGAIVTRLACEGGRRTVIVGGTSPHALAYKGELRPAVLVWGVDTATLQPVAWVAVPDQRISFSLAC